MNIEQKLREVIIAAVEAQPHYRHTVMSGGDIATDIIPGLLENFKISERGWVAGRGWVADKSA